MASEEKAQVSIEYLLVIAAVITLVVVISLFLKGSILARWLGIAENKSSGVLNETG